MNESSSSISLNIVVCFQYPYPYLVRKYLTFTGNTARNNTTYRSMIVALKCLMYERPKRVIYSEAFTAPKNSW